MATIGDIRIRIGGNIKSLEKSLVTAERRLKRSGERMARLGDQMTSGITLALAGAGFAAIKSAGDFQDLENSMISAMGSAETAKKEIALLRREALKPGLNFKQAVLGSVRLQAVETDAELARRGISAYGNALALAGKKGSDLDGVTLALSQIASKGKISAEELNQIAERVPQIRKVLKDAFGTADSEQLTAKGIGFEEFLSKTIVELEKLPKAKAGINTFLENIKLDFQETFAVIGERVFPIIKEISSVVVKLAKAFTALPPPLQDNIIQFALLAAVAGPVLKIYGGLKILTGTLVGATGSLVGSFGALFSVKKKGIPIGAAFVGVIKAAINPIGALFAGISRLLIPLNSASGGFKRLGAAILFTAKNPIKAMRLAMISLGTTLAGITLPITLIVAGLAAFGVAVAANIGPARKLFVDLSNSFIDLYKKSTIVRAGFEAIAFAGKSLFSIVVNLGKIFFETFKGIGKTIAAILKGDFSSISEIVTSSFEKIKTAGSQIGEDVGKAFSNAVDKTINGRPDLSFITEADVQKTVDKASKIVKGVNDKIFGIENIETPDFDFKDLSGKTFDRDAKQRKEKKKEKEPGRGVFTGEAADINTQTSLLPEGLQKHLEGVRKLGEAYSNLRDRSAETAAKIGESFGAILESGIEDGLTNLGTTLGDVISGTAKGTNLLGSVLSSIAGVMVELGKMAIGAGIAIKGIKEALKSLNPFVAIAGGVALVTLGSVIKNKASKLASPPKLAAGGIASGRTLVEVGEYPGAKVNPEVIAPLDKLKSLIQPAGMAGNITLDGEFRILGTDLVMLLNRAAQQGYRVNSL